MLKEFHQNDDIYDMILLSVMLDGLQYLQCNPLFKDHLSCETTFSWMAEGVVSDDTFYCIIITISRMVSPNKLSDEKLVFRYFSSCKAQVLTGEWIKSVIYPSSRGVKILKCCHPTHKLPPVIAQTMPAIYCRYSFLSMISLG